MLCDDIICASFLLALSALTLHTLAIILLQHSLVKAPGISLNVQ